MLKVDETKPIQYLMGTGVWADATLIDANFMDGNTRKSVYKMHDSVFKRDFIRYLYDYDFHEKYWRNKKDTITIGVVLLEMSNGSRFTVSYCSKNTLGVMKSYEDVVKCYNNFTVIHHMSNEVELDD